MAVVSDAADSLSQIVAFEPSIHNQSPENDEIEFDLMGDIVTV